MTHVYIATPSKSGMVPLNYMMSLLGSMSVFNKCDPPVITSLDFDTGKSCIDTLRSEVATRFLKSTADYLMFIDDDMAWQPELIADLIALDLDVVGVPYRQKDTKIVYNMRTNHAFDMHPAHKNVMKVHDIATGLLLIKKKVFEVLKDKVEWVMVTAGHPEVGLFFRHQVVKDPVGFPNGETSYMSEDFYFCRLAREAGFDIWAYTDAQTAHHGNIAFVGDYGQVVCQMRGEKYEPKRGPLGLNGSFT